MSPFQYYFFILVCIPFIASAQQITDSIPFKYEKGSILVDAKINGKDCKLIFDTGSPHTDVTGDFAKLLGWTYPQERTHLGILQIGTYRKQTIFRSIKGAPYNCPGFSIGHIGYETMKGKIWMIDYLKGMIYILAAPPPLAKALHVIPFRFSNIHQMISSVEVNGKELLLQHDTGFSSIGKRPIMLDEEFMVAECKDVDSLCYESVCGDRLNCRKKATITISFSDSFEMSVETLGMKKLVDRVVLGNAFYEHYKPVFDLKNNQLLLLLGNE
jgi:hypothetical protein